MSKERWHLPQPQVRVASIQAANMELDRIAPYQQHRGPETRPRQRSLCSHSQGLAGVFFPLEGVFVQDMVGQQAREEADLTRWHSLIYYPLVLM